MAHLPLEGSVVCYEFLDAEKKWLWGVGTVIRFDDRVCVISQWVGAPVDKAMAAKLESEAASSKAEAKTHQERLLAIRDRIESQSCGTLKEEKERTSEELSECLVLIGKHRNRSRSLLADLETITGPSTAQVKCQQFTPGSCSIAVLRSSILRVISQVTIPSVLLSSEEVDSIEKAVTYTHSQLNGELHKLRSTVEATEIECSELRDQIRDLEEQLKRVKTTSEPVRIPDGGGSGSTLTEKLKEHDPLSLRGAWDTSTALVMTKHTITFPWDDGDTLLHHKPEETKSVFAAEAAFACCVPIQCVMNPKMAAHGKHLSAEFSVSHPETVTTKEIDQRLASYAFPSMYLLHEEPLGVKTGLDRAIEDLEHALGIPEGKHEGLYFDEFMENIPDTTFSKDKDAYESEIGDLLMLLDKLNNENRSLQYTLDKSAAELKRQVSEAQKDHDALSTEVTWLRNIVSKLKDLAEQQEQELEGNRVQKQRAEEARFHNNLAPLGHDAQDTEYAVTMEEYKRQKEATDDARTALVEQKAKAEQMHHLLTEHEQECAQHANQLRSLQEAFAAENNQNAENLCTLESELIDVLLQLKASEALSKALRNINSQQQAELAAFRAKRNAALEARDATGTLLVPSRPVPADEAAERALGPQQIADEPLYAVTLEEYLGKDAAVEQLAAELAEQKAEAERVAEEVAAFRAKRNAALEARDAAGTLPVPSRPVPADEAAERALGPQQIADEPLYAVTLEEYLGKDAAVEQLAAELAEQKAEAERVAEEVAAFRAKRNAALEARDATGTLPVPSRPVPADEAAERALGPQQIADEPLYAVTLEEYLGKDAAVEQLAAELAEQKAEAERVAEEVAAFRAKRNAALEARDATGTLPVPSRPVPADEAAERALGPQQIADEPLYAVTLEEYLGKDAAVEQLAAELAEQKAEAERVAEEVAAFRAKRNAALEARDATGTLLVPSRPVPADEAAERALGPQQIADEPLYAVTLEEYLGKDAAVEQLAAELAEQKAEAERVAEEVAAFRAKRNAALEARDATGTLLVPSRPVPADEAAERALGPQQIADEPLYAVTLEELEQAREDAARGVAAIEDNAAALESELLDVLAELKAMKGQNDALKALCEMKDAALADLEKHDVRACNSDKAKPQTTSRHTKVFEGDEWGAVVETKPHALHDAFVTDVCAACRVGRDDLSEIAFALGSLQATVSVMHDSDMSCDDIARLVEEYHYPNVWALYAKRLAPKNGLDEAKDTISQLQDALAAKAEEAARVANKLEEQQAEAERVAEEVAAFRAKRNAALEARDAAGTLPVPSRPVPADEAAERALGPQQIADEPLYAVTLEEYLGKDAAVEQLAAELAEQKAEAERVAEEVAAFRAKRNAALEARDAAGTLPVPSRPVPADEAAERALGPQQIADEPLYAVTLEEYLGKDAAVEQLAAELAEQKAEAERVAEEVAAFRAKRNAALEARDATGTLPVPSRPVPADEAAERALGPQQIADEPLYAVTLEEYLGKDAAVEQLAAELAEQKAEAERVAEEVAAFRAKRNAALEARDAAGTLPVPSRPVPADEAAERALGPQQIADEPLYAVTLEEYLGKDAAVEQLAAELAEQKAEAERVAEEVAAFRAKRNAALEARDATGTLPVPSRPVPADEAAERALGPQQIADEPLYAVTLEEYLGKDAAVEQLAAELAEQKAEAERVAEEVAAFRAKRNAALEARDAAGTLPVPSRPVPADEAAERALGPQQIADEPLYAVTLEEYLGKDAAVEQLAAELAEQKAEAERVAEEVAAFRAKRNAALEARDAAGTLPVPSRPVPADEAAERALGPQQIADEPLYAVTLEEYLGKDAAVEQLAAELAEQKAEAERVAEEVAAFRAKRNAALEARDATGTLPVPSRPVPADEAAERALGPQQIADEPLYAVTLEEYLGKDAAVEQLAAELAEQKAEAERVAEEVAAFRAKRNAALEARDAAGTLPVPSRPVPADEAAERALGPQQIADEPLYAVTLEEYLGKDAAVEQLAAELAEQKAEAERVAEEVAAFRAKRNAALEARDATGTLPVPSRPVPADEAAERALGPQQIADEPLYAVTLEEYLGKDAAVEQLAAELAEQKAEAERVAEEVAAFRAKRNAALEARDAAGTLPVPSRPVPADEAAERALGPQQIADEPLYAVTLEEYLGKDAAVEQLAAELAEQKAEAERVAEEVAAFRAKRNAALEARDAAGTLPVPSRPVPADEAAERALGPQQIADEPLYAVTLEELEQAREDAARGVAAIEDNAAALESELLDVLAELKAMKGQNDALKALCEMKDAALADLEKHDVRACNSDKAKPQTTSRHTKVFEGDEWGAVVETKPHALHDAFVTDVCAACRVGRDDLSEIAFALGSLQATVSVMHDSDMSCDDIARLVEEYHYPNVWALYAKRLAPKNGLDEAKDTISQLQDALAAKAEEAARVANKLEEQQAEAERVAEEVAAFRAKRNAALEARDAAGTLPVPSRPVPADEAAERALGPQQIADEPLYAVTLEEYLGKDAAVEQLAAELAEQKAEAERVAEEVAAFRAKRNAALEARDAAGTLPVPSRPVPADEAAERALGPQQIADEPLYAVTLEEYLGKDAAVEQLAAELAEQKAEAERVAEEVAAFRAKRNAALEARDAAGTLPVPSRPVPADEAAERALGPQQIADEPLYAVTLEEYLGKDAAVEQLAAELAEQKAEAERVAEEVAAFRAKRNAALEARDATGTLLVPSRPVPADEAAERALGPQQIADEPLYAVTLEEYLGKDAAVEQLAAELAEQKAEAERVAEEVAAFRAKRNAALEARDAAGTLPVPSRPVPADEAAERALGPQQIADEPLYAVTLEELEQAREDAARGVAAIEDNAAALESELLDVLAELKAMKGQNDALKALCEMKDAALADLEKHDVRACNSDKAKPQTTSRHTKVFEGDEWGAVVETKPHALHDAFVTDVCAACRVGRDDLSEIAFALGSLQATVSVMHDSDMSCDDIARLVEEYHYPNVWALYAKRLAPKNGLDEAKDTISQLQDALAAKAEEAARVANKLEEQQAEAERVAEEVAAFRAKRNAALEARDAAGTLPVPSRPVPADEAAERALGPQQIADEPLYAVTLEEYLGKDAAVEQLAAELAEQKAEAERVAEEVAAFRAKRNAALEARDATGTLLVPSRPVPADEAAERALGPQQIADEPLYAVTLEEYLGKDAAVEQLAAELAEQKAEAERVAEEVAAFRAKRNAALEARDATGTLLVPSRPVPADEAAERALGPQQIADEPLYAVTLEEYLGKDAAVEQLAAELAEQKAEAERVAEEVAAFRAKRNAALEARDATGTLLVPSRPVPADEAAERALGPQQIADEPLYAVTLEEYLGKDAAVEQLAAELAEQKAEAERVAEEVAAFRAKRNAALEARDAAGTLPVPSRPVPADEAAERALGPQQIADEPLYAVTLEELEQAREDAARGVAAIEDNAAALESELLDVLAELKAMKGQNDALKALCEMKDAALADLEKHDVRACNSDKAKPQTTSQHTKVFEGDEWGAVVETKPHALHDAFVTDVCAACRVGRDDLSEIAFALGSLQATVSVMHDSDMSCDDIARLVEEYHYPNVWALYAKRLAPKNGLDEAKDTISQLQDALAAKAEEAARVANKLEEQQAEAERVAEEVAAFRAKRNAALEARDAAGTLPVPSRPVPADEAAERALGPQQIADEPLYAVTLEELDAVRSEAESRALEVEELGRQVCEKGYECGDLLEKLEDAVTLLAEARNESEDVRGQLSEAARTSERALGAMEKDRAKVAAELSALRLMNDELVSEVRAFRRRRLDAIACRAAEGGFSCEALTEKVEGVGVDAPVSAVIIEREPLFCVRLEELKEQRDLNAQMVLELSALGERIRDAMDPDAVTDPSSEAVLSHLEALLKALEVSREAEQAWRELAEERERELEQLRKLFKNEEERLQNDLEEAREEVERLQCELDLLTDKLDEACRLFGDADAVSAEGVAKLEAFAEVLAAARDTEKAAMEQLEAKESELEELRTALKDAKVWEEMRENLEDEVKQLQKEKEITETELGALQKEMNDLRYDLRAAEDRAAEKAREVERMTLDLDSLNNRIQDLLEELEEKTDQYNQVIKDLDDFANNQSHETEKELLQRLAACEQELFELQEARRGENDEHEKQVGVLQDQINRLRNQTDQDNTLHNGLQDELARLRKLLLDAEAALRDKSAENEALKDDMENMIDEHEAQMREMEQELEGKGKEVSDALERLEEMSAMVQEAREGEESALRLRADSDAEVFRLQKELDKIKRLQSAMAESGDDKSSLFAQIIDTEGQLRDAVAIIRKKDAELDEVEKEWQKKLNKSEDLNHDLRRLLKRTMAALSKSKDTMGNSAGALDAFRDELKPMMQ
ncbi:hypothetical protein LMJF_34_2530 [Leishmania major strain Friedlin]|uniref:Flagellar attachment zone protein 1 conserved domain-containing protein n=1 Tax=Leishmania major TaxID=5664 RepID=Q4Q2U2_LEIMA|nr:hypothetical protein LMJF_34_2530 [Leishmania major strain Friedlin]CAJ07973.1 hypothetical protein LMJF_34_2530 [Leishmania major strain Friedlin]|eukprot:XP_001686356.1 hypothetical protein LMJF_34_2530 [Leishmania major strain Friedlin]